METRLTPLEEHILQVMNDGLFRSNRELSSLVCYPEPSVRRATAKLAKLQRLSVGHEDYRTGRIAWRLAA